MNKAILSGKALEKALAAKLEELLRGVAWLRGWQVEHVGSDSDIGFDLLASVPLSDGGKAALCIECKGEMRPSVFRMMADKVFSPAGSGAFSIRLMELANWHLKNRILPKNRTIINIESAIIFSLQSIST